MTNVSSDELKYWVAFSRIPRIGAVRAGRLESHFGSMAAARGAVLYVRGTLLPGDEWSVAVVGTRRATPYGRQAAEHFAGDLARQGITVVRGPLITARQALDQNREVFAVPGPIYAPGHRGANKLIREGEAKLVTKTEDILEELNLTMATQQLELREVAPADETEAALLKVLSSQPIHIDEVQRASGLSIAAVSGALALLELKGMVRQVGPMSYVRARDVVVSYNTS